MPVLSTLPTLSHARLKTESYETEAEQLGQRRDAEQLPGPSLPRAGWKLDTHGGRVGRHGPRGTGVGHRLAANSGLGALQQWQV